MSQYILKDLIISGLGLENCIKLLDFFFCRKLLFFVLGVDQANGLFLQCLDLIF